MGGTQSKESSLEHPAATSAPPGLQRQPQSETAPQPIKTEDYDAPLKGKPLNQDLQKMIDAEEEDVWDQVYEGHYPETTDTNLRYAAYANRLRTILLSAHRYVAYTSDIGESFRPVAHPWLVRSAYGISWAYLIGDVSHEGYKAYLRQQKTLFPELTHGKAADAATNATGALKQGDLSGMAQRVKEGSVAMAEEVKQVVVAPVGSGHVPAIEDYRAVMAQRAIFQGIASMGLPAFTIHSIVRYSGRALKDAKNARIRTWGPIGLGLAAVPFLPFIFDKPVEEAVEYAFHTGFRYIGGPNAVGHARTVGREQELENQNVMRKATAKEKEL